jgi:hypothetical protein
MKSKGCKQLHDPHPHPKEKIRTTNPTKKKKLLRHTTLKYEMKF